MSWNIQKIQPDNQLCSLTSFLYVCLNQNIFSRGHATLHLAVLVGRSVRPSVTFLNCEQFSHYCSCPTVRDWIAVYPALFLFVSHKSQLRPVNLGHSSRESEREHSLLLLLLLPSASASASAFCICFCFYSSSSMLSSRRLFFITAKFARALIIESHFYHSPPL